MLVALTAGLLIFILAVALWPSDYHTPDSIPAKELLDQLKDEYDDIGEY